MLDLSDLTLVMCTYNRPKYAIRAIKFWAKQNVNLIVLDGSSGPLDKEFTDSLPKFVRYIHSESGWTDRMLMGANLSKTNFTSLINDDEFYLPNSLSVCIETLRDCPQLVSTTGNAVIFKVLKQEVYFKRKYSEFMLSQVTSDHSFERVAQHMNPYRMTSLFAVTRTPVFINNVKVANLCSHLPITAAFELGFEIANSYQGQSRVLPILHWFRSAENPPIWNTKNYDFGSWIEDEKNSAQFLELSNHVDRILEVYPEDKNSYEKSVLYVGLHSYIAGGKTLTKNPIVLAINYSRKFLITHFKLLAHNTIGEFRLLNLLEYIFTKFNKEFFESRWRSTCSMIYSLSNAGIQVSETCVLQVTDAIKSSYIEFDSKS